MFGLKMKRGEMGIISLVIGVILVILVLIPVTVDSLKAINSSILQYSTAKTVLDLFPLFGALLGLVLIASYFMGGRRR